MPLSEAKRFAADLARDKELLDRVKPKISGLASFAEVGRENGYDFTVEDAKELVRGAVGPEKMSNEQLDSVAGAGFIGGGMIVSQAAMFTSSTLATSQAAVTSQLAYTSSVAMVQTQTQVSG